MIGIKTIEAQRIQKATNICLDGIDSGDLQELECTQVADHCNTIAILITQDI